jgi:two-component system response regulator YesN
MRIMKMIANKGVLQIFFALLLIVIIMFVSNYIVFKNSISEIYGQVNENNRLIVKSVIQSFDDSFRDINNLIYSINMLPYDTLNSTKDGRTDMLNAYFMQKNIAMLLSSANTDYIEEVVTFFNDSDFAVTSIGTINLHEFFRQQYRHEIYNSNYWKSFASKQHSLTVFPENYYIETTNAYGENRRKVMVIVGSNNLSSKNVMVFINVDKLLEHVQQRAMMEGTSLIVLDQSRNVILSTDKNWSLGEVINNLYLGAEREVTLKKKDYEYSSYISDYNGFIYINKVPFQFANIETVTKANRFIMLTTIVGAIILSAILSIYLYKPVKDILQLFGGRNRWGSGYRAIQSGIMEIQDENESYRLQMNLINSELRRVTFLDALDELSHSQEFERKMQEYFADFLKSRNFAMAAFYLKPKQENKATSVRIEEINQAIKNNLRTRFDNIVVFHAGNLRFLSMVGIDKPSDRGALVKETGTFIKKAEKNELREYSVLAAVSKLYPSDIKNCHLAYQDLEYCMEYRNINVREPVIDIDSICFTWKVYFPMDQLDKLSNCLISGNVDDGTGIINHIIDANVKMNVHHHQLVNISKCVFSLILKHLEMNDMEQREILQVERKFIREMGNSFNFNEIREALVGMVQFASGKNKNHQGKLNPNFIKQYIDLHYMENLYLDHMAEVLETSPKYFSNYFKKTFGINYVEYINKVRISHAKEYLKKTDLSVTEIGEMIGYMNSTTFTSTFKKYCGVTPSEYRKKALVNLG